MSEPLTFETALAELEQVLRCLEDGTTTLDESLTRYERGVALLKHCYGQLRDAEARIALLTGEHADGNPVLEPFEHQDAVAAEKTRRNGRKSPTSF